MVHALKYLLTVHVQYTNIPMLSNSELYYSSKKVEIKLLLIIITFCILRNKIG